MTHVPWEEMSVVLPAETLANEVAEMSQADDENVADVGGEDDVVRWVLFGDALVRRACAVLRGVAVVLVRAVPKLGVHGGEHLV